MKFLSALLLFLTVALLADDEIYTERRAALVRELRQANEILRNASAYFAQAELDRPLKR